jgi:hypothetical protein
LRAFLFFLWFGFAAGDSALSPSRNAVGVRRLISGRVGEMRGGLAMFGEFGPALAGSRAHKVNPASIVVVQKRMRSLVMVALHR